MISEILKSIIFLFESFVFELYSSILVDTNGISETENRSEITSFFLEHFLALLLLNLGADSPNLSS